jgi:hypothetical protein
MAARTNRALREAVDRNNTKAIKKLLQRGADVNTLYINGMTPIWVAAQKGHLDVVRVLVEHRADVNIPNNDGFTPISVAALEGHVNVVRALAEYAADVNIPEHDGVTPICIAAINGYTDVVRALVEHGAEINGATNGWSPVIAAAARGHLDIISLLYVLGASMAPPAALANEGGGGRSTDTTCRMAVDVAQRYGHEKAVLLIESILCELAGKKCHHCDHSPFVRHALYRCSVCNTTLYCSRDCQVQDWKEHKSSCRLRECVLLHLLQR